jgi:hypothetical protein
MPGRRGESRSDIRKIEPDRDSKISSPYQKLEQLGQDRIMRSLYEKSCTFGFYPDF